MNLLLDTNVIIDYLGCRQPFFENAKRIVIAALYKDVDLWVPAQSLADAFYVLNKLTESETLQRAIVKSLEIIKPVSLTATELERAGRLLWPDYEDCLISLAANKVNADFLITRDKSGFDRSSVPVASPEEWLEIMKIEHGLQYDEVRI